MCRSLTFFCVAFITASAPAAEKTGFLDRTLRGSDGVEVKYTVFVPHDHDPKSKLPVILFLHGSGQFGTDGRQPAQVGIGEAIRAREKSFPFVVVFPQAQKIDSLILPTWFPGHAEGDRALAMLAAVEKEFATDPNRVYLTGISMGGYGTWAMAERNPSRWAAIAPICGGGDPDWVMKIKSIPCWCFHGDADPIVPVTASRTMIDALKKAGGSPRYDELAGVQHNAWDKAYANSELYEWFLKHTTK